MNLKEQVSKNAAAGQQAACTPSGCKACQRKGIAIYPLRVAVAPKPIVNTAWKPVVPTQEVALSGGEFKYALRTLRAGYVYVLIDKKKWLGYQVTAEGYLREFNVYEIPEGEKIESLSTACLTQNHDILASFININIDPVPKKVMVAFSNDPWSKKVLDEYKSGKRPAARFTHLTINNNKICTADPKRSLILDPSLAALKSNVLEFATDSYPGILGKEGETGGAFGFYSRMNKEKQAALGGRIAHLQQQYGAPVNAIVLDDTVGIVQELNHARMDVVDALAEYRSKAEVIHQSTISDAILYLHRKIDKQIEEDPEIKPTSIYMPAPPEPALVIHEPTITVSREENVAEAKRSALKRLQKYYSEPDRAKFARTYQATIENYIQKMGAVAEDLENWYQATLWLMVIRQDYSPETSLISWAAQLTMLAGNLQGGTAGMDMDKEKNIWKTWMETPDSPPFMSLLGKEPGLVNAVYHGSATYYGGLKSFLTSQEVCDFIDSLNFNLPASQLTMSMNAAFSLAGEQLSEKARRGFERTLQALAAVSEGEPVVTIFSGEMTIREFQEVMRGQLNARGQPVWSVQRNGQNSSHAGTWMQVTEPEILEQKIRVRFASLLKDIESPEFKKAVRKAGTSPSALKKGTLLNDGRQLASLPYLKLAPAELDNALIKGEMSMGLGNSLKIVGQQYQLPRRVFSSSGLGLVLGAVMLALQGSATADNIKALKEAVPGDTKAELQLTSSALMVAASAVEVVGLTHMVGRWGTNPWDLKPNAVVRGVEKYVHPLLRVAGVIGGIASMVEAIGMFMDGYRAGKQGDIVAKSLYQYAGFFTFAGGFAGMQAAYSANFALFGPVGLCIGLLILGAVLAFMAASNVRSSLEIWLSDTCFGIADMRGDHDKVWNASSLSDLQAAMKAFYAIVSGFSVHIQRERLAEFGFNTIDAGLITVQAKLPGCSRLGSDWLVELVAKDNSGGKQLLTRVASPNKLGGFKAPKQQSVDTYAYTVMPVSLPVNPVMKETWNESGLLMEGEFVFDKFNFTEVELNVTYWPDKTDSDHSMQLSVTSED